MNLPSQVQAVTGTFLEAADRATPGLVEGFYVVGSVALGNFRAQGSDIDFVAVTARTPDAASLVALDRVHQQLRARQPQPFFDGIYVTWDELANDPALAGAGPSSHESHLSAQDRGERHPVTWHTLARYGITCRGPRVSEVAIWQDAAVLAAWTDRNLDNYWRRYRAQQQRLFTRAGLAGLTAWTCAWSVLGVSRLHYTLATGDITSKQGAGQYALQTFPAQWQQVIEEALQIHGAGDSQIGRRSRYRLPLARRRDVLAFTEMVIEDAHRLYAARLSRLQVEA